MPKIAWFTDIHVNFLLAQEYANFLRLVGSTEAEAIILTYLDTSVSAAWVSPATAPGPVTAAILLALGDLFEHRGDDQTLSEKTWAAIERILVQSRNAAIA